MAYAEMQRLIREQEPVKPSTRISSSGAALTILASQRSETPDQLRQVVRGELDWIVMKALEKDRERRYSTALAFAADVQNYLRNDPVTACPPSTWYRFRKYAYRHRIAVGTAAAVVAMLAVISVTTSVALLHVNDLKLVAEAELARRIEAESALQEQLAATQQAKQEALSHLARYRDRLVEDALQAFMGGDLRQGQRALQAVEDAGVERTTVQTLRGVCCFFDGKITQAIDELRAVLDEDPKNVLAKSFLGFTSFHSFDWSYINVAKHDLRNMTPRTDYERLMVAWALHSLPDITRLIEERPSWVMARLIRATILTDPEHVNRENIDKMIDDIHWSRQVFRNSPWMDLMDLCAHTNAIEYGRENALDTGDWEEAAAQAAKRLTAFPDYFCPLQRFYYTTIGDETTAAKLLERSRSLHRDIPFLRAITAYEKGDDQLALKELDGSDFHRNLTLRALLTAHCDREAALALFRDVMAERSDQAWPTTLAKALPTGRTSTVSMVRSLSKRRSK